MARLIITDKPKPRLDVVEPRTRRRITPKEIEKGLGAERVASVPSGGSPLSAYALRQELFRRLRSTGGRPGLDGADLKPKVPMRRSRWKKLQELAKQVASGTFRPSPAQLASVILDAGIDQFEQALHVDSARAGRLNHEVREKPAQLIADVVEAPMNKVAKDIEANPFDKAKNMSLHERNLVLLRAARDIFGFSRGRSWTDFKKSISGQQIRSFYEVHASLSTPDTDWASIMPTPDGKLRGLYLGDIRPELTLKNIVRFNLYSDSIFVINPFINPHIIKPQYNPIENPDQYKADMLNLVHFLFSVAPWLESGMVYLLPDPGDLNVAIKWETARLAKARYGDRAPDESDLEEGRAQGRKELRRVLFALPDRQLLRQLEKVGPAYTEKQKKCFLAYARQELRKDPIALEQPPGSNLKGGQMMPFRAGTNLETALLICGVTGAFPYTNMSSVWRQIIEARDEMSETARTWSPFTKAFQSLDFRFLDNVDVRFAQSIREDGRLEGFRSLLRKVGNEAANITNLSSLDSYVRDCKDELRGEYTKAQAEWSKIDESFLKWVGGGGAAAAGIVTGHLVPDVASLSAAIVHTLTQLGIRYFQRKQFRMANPMSVLIDLSHKEPPGVTLF
jgi:hypothetical protein